MENREDLFQHCPVFDRSSRIRWRQRRGEGKLQALLQKSLSIATWTKGQTALTSIGSGMA